MSLTAWFRSELDDIALVPEMLVENGLGNARRGGDIGGGAVVETLAGQAPLGGLDDALLPLRGRQSLLGHSPSLLVVGLFRPGLTA